MLRIVISNCTPGESKSLAQALVGEGLAACVNVVPGVTSYFVWEGAACEEPEHTLVIKTTAERYEALKARLLALHSYETPEIVALDTVDVLDAYMTWARGCVQRVQSLQKDQKEQKDRGSET